MPVDASGHVEALVWCEDWGRSEDNAKAFSVLHILTLENVAVQAAERFAELEYGSDPFEQVIVQVRVEGEVYQVTVNVDFEPIFSGYISEKR